MKLQIIKTMAWVAVMTVASIVNVKAQIVETDPVVSAAVIANTEEVGGEIKKTNNNLTVVTAQNTVMMATLDSIRNYEKTMLRSLQKVHGIFDNIFTAVDIVNKVQATITELNECRVAAQNHPQGLVVSAVVSRRYATIINETASLVDNIREIVKKESSVNLLNSAERMQVLYDTHRRVTTIYANIRALKYQIGMYRWSDIVREISPQVWASYYNVDAAYRRCLGDIDKLKRIF